MQKLLVDTETGTILDLSTCVIVAIADDPTDDLTDDVIVGFARKHGKPIEG